MKKRKRSECETEMQVWKWEIEKLVWDHPFAYSTLNLQTLILFFSPLLISQTKRSLQYILNRH